MKFEIWNLRILRKSFEKMQVPLKIWRDETNVYFSWRKFTFFLLYLAYFFLEWLHQRPSVLRNTYTACLVSLLFPITPGKNLNNLFKRYVDKWYCHFVSDYHLPQNVPLRLWDIAFPPFPYLPLLPLADPRSGLARGIGSHCMLLTSSVFTVVSLLRGYEFVPN